MLNNSIRPDLITFIVLLTIMSGTISIGIYTPSFPEIADTLNTGDAQIQLTLTLFLLGFGISQLFYGPFSDKHGRRKTLLIGVSIFIFGSFICFIASSVYSFMLGRLIQGLGIGAANTISFAILRDLFTDHQLVKRLSLLSIVAAFSAIIAPTIGGYLQYYASWRITFFVLCCYGIILNILIWRNIPETNQHLTTNALNPNILFKNYFALLKHREFIGYSLIASFIFTMPLVINAMLPFIFIDGLALSPLAFGWLVFLSVSGYFIGALCGGQFAERLGINSIIYLGNLILFFAAAIGLLLGAIGYLNVATVVIPLTLLMFGAGLVFPNSVSGALFPFSKLAGSASALLSAMFSLVAALTIIISAHLPEADQTAMIALLIALASLALITFWFVVPKQTMSHDS